MNACRRASRRKNGIVIATNRDHPGCLVSAIGCFSVRGSELPILQYASRRRGIGGRAEKGARRAAGRTRGGTDPTSIRAVGGDTRDGRMSGRGANPVPVVAAL